MGENMKKLKLIVLNNSKELGELVDKNLKKRNDARGTYKVKITENRFSNGEGKIRIDDTVNGSDLFIISDVGNYV